jgi:hypothetical protein
VRGESATVVILTGEPSIITATLTSALVRLEAIKDVNGSDPKLAQDTALKAADP